MPTRASLAEQRVLLLLELCVREHAVGAQVGELGQRGLAPQIDAEQRVGLRLEWLLPPSGSTSCTSFHSRRLRTDDEYVILPLHV